MIRFKLKHGPSCTKILNECREAINNIGKNAKHKEKSAQPANDKEATAQNLPQEQEEDGEGDEEKRAPGNEDD